MVDLGELRHMDVQHRAAEISDNEFSDFLMAIVPDVIDELTALRAKVAAGERLRHALANADRSLSPASVIANSIAAYDAAVQSGTI